MRCLHGRAAVLLSVTPSRLLCNPLHLKRHQPTVMSRLDALTAPTQTSFVPQTVQDITQGPSCSIDGGGRSPSPGMPVCYVTEGFRTCVEQVSRFSRMHHEDLSHSSSVT